MRDFVELVIWTGQLSDERPVSAIVVAPAGSGKTSLLEQLECKQAMFSGDLTSRPLSNIVRQERPPTHILLGDMLAIFGHKESTVKLTKQLISQLTGEKLGHDPWSGVAIAPRMIGLVTAIPPEDLKQPRIKRALDTGGFASRFLLIRYIYKPSTIAAIHRWIARNGYADAKPKSFGITNPGQRKVVISDRMADEIRDFGRELRTDPIGFRAHRHLRALVKASARRRELSEAERKDFELVQQYAEFFSREGKEI